MFYDLHIHSGLSPCADDDMSPQNIIRMAKINGLDLIAVTDHNSLKQQRIIARVAREHGLKIWYGVELQSKEEVHCLAYFKTLKQADEMQNWIESYQEPTPNNVEYFGNQFLYDNNDEVLVQDSVALILSLKASLKACVETIHSLHGKVVLAHIYGRQNGIVEQLGFIPPDLKIDGVELSRMEDLARFRKEYPKYKLLPCFFNSDAHCLQNIHEAEHSLSKTEIQSFWRN